MAPSDLAAKIAEEVFRTIERENGIVKAQIAEAVETALAKEMPAFLKSRGKTWGLWSDYGLPVPGAMPAKPYEWTETGIAGVDAPSWWRSV